MACNLSTNVQENHQICKGYSKVENERMDVSTSVVSLSLSGTVAWLGLTIEEP